MSQEGAAPGAVPFWMDWRFVASTIVAVAGILIPVVLWQNDRSQSLEVKIVSKVSLAIDSWAVGEDVRVSIGGETVQNPYLSTLELVNNGNKPIPLNDYHSPVKFTVVDEVQIC